jgi:hypothetical protein
VMAVSVSVSMPHAMTGAVIAAARPMSDGKS